MLIEVIDMKKEAKQQSEKPDRVRATVWMNRDIWSAARHAALDKGVAFGRLVEDALTVYLTMKVKS
jgi:hypothetical protein